MTKLKALALLILFAVGCKREASTTSDTSSTSAATGAITDTGSNAMALKITSSAFQPNGSIPSQYTCEGKDISPPLAWSGAAGNAKSFAMIVDDPDAPDPAKPQRVYVHWVVYNLPASTTGLPENASKAGLPN